MSQWQIALVREQGINFAVATVKDHVINNRSEADDLITALTLRLGQPTVLLGAEDLRYYGRDDIVRFLSKIHPSRLPWRKVQIAA